MTNTKGMLGFLLLLLTLSGSQAVAPTRCFEPQRCTDATVLKVVADVDLAECADLCSKENQCQYYVEDTSTGLCSVYESCSASEFCETCIFGSKKCSQFVECFVEELTCSEEADIIEEIETSVGIEECNTKCAEEYENECSYFDYQENIYDEEAPKKCVFLKNCPKPNVASMGSVASRAFCHIDDYNCYKPLRCIGKELTSFRSRATECYVACKNDVACAWFEYQEGVCSLLSSCDLRVACPTCILGKKDCPAPPPNQLVYVRTYKDASYLQLESLRTGNMHSERLNQPQIPLDINEVRVFCKARNSNIAVICDDKFCYHFDFVQDKWAKWATELPQYIDYQSVACTSLDDDTILISGINNADPDNNAFVFKADANEPERLAIATQDHIDERSRHCIARLGGSLANQFLVVGGGLDAKLTNLAAIPDSKVIKDLEELKDNDDMECGYVGASDPDDQLVVFAGGKDLGQRESVLVQIHNEWRIIPGPQLPRPLTRLTRIDGLDDQLYLLGLNRDEWQMLRFDRERGWIVVREWEDNGQVEGIALAFAISLISE